MGIDEFRLQLITQKETTADILSEVKTFLEGGGRWVQLRMKNAPSESILETGAQVMKLCKEYGSVFILNDNPELAAELGCDGVHLGKNDTHPVQARAYIGDSAIIGCTANTIDDIRELLNQPIDYIGLGPYRFTTTKKNLSPSLGLDGYKSIFAESIKIPIVVIGGIELEDISPLKSSGATNFAVSGAISRSDNPKEKTIKFLEEIWRN